MDFPPDIPKHLAGPVGSAVALYFMKGTWRMYVGALAGGIAMSHYVGPVVHDVFPRLGAETSGFLVGLFGVIVVKKAFDTWEQFDVGTIVKDWLRKLAGIDKETPK